MASAPGSAPDTGPSIPAPTSHRQRWVMLGLLLTFVGLVFVTLALPGEPSSLLAFLPYMAGAVLCLWIGGILLGMAVGMKTRSRPRPPPS